MPRRRGVSTADGRATVARVLADSDSGQAPSTADLRVAVRYLLDELAARAPGRSVEVRVPPYAAVQCVEGVRHTRGTPPNVVEVDPATWVLLATGRTSWEAAVQDGRVSASGERADLAAYLPLATGLTDAEVDAG